MKMWMLEPIKRIKRSENRIGSYIIGFLICVIIIILTLCIMDENSLSIVIPLLIVFSLAAIGLIMMFILEYKKSINQKHIKTAEEYFKKHYNDLI